MDCDAYPSVRHKEVKIDTDLFGYLAEITQQLNTISAIRITPDGRKVYLPEYARSLNDAWHIIEWCSEQERGGGWVGMIEGEYVATLKVDGATVKENGRTPADAISNAALALIEIRGPNAKRHDPPRPSSSYPAGGMDRGKNLGEQRAKPTFGVPLGRSI